MNSENPSVTEALSILIKHARHLESSSRFFASFMVKEKNRQALRTLACQCSWFAGGLEEVALPFSESAHLIEIPAIEVHPRWLQILPSLEGEDDIILRVIESPLRSAIKEYKRSIRMNLPETVLIVLSEQERTLKNIRSKIREINQAYDYSMLPGEDDAPPVPAPKEKTEPNEETEDPVNP